QVNIAKPIMMLSIIRGIENGSIKANRILYSESLITSYNKLFTSYSDNAITPSEYPFYYLGSEDFYYIKGKKAQTTPSAKFLRENVEYACLDDDLWELLQEPETRKELKEAIIRHFLELRPNN
ncbi:MAG: hypothetical protein IKS36_07280, partial [Bacteroidales bacterium]|nr:hypothetical protein [Bacteroidales bacterium]